MFVLLVSTLLLSGIATEVENDHAVTTCDVPSMKEGHSTTLTCHFSDDFADLQSKVKIVHYSTDVQKVVILCNMSTGQPECESEPGYYVAGNVNGTLLVVIPHTSRTHVGRYSCQLNNSAPPSHVTCSFSFRQVGTTCDIPAVRAQQPTNLTCQFNEDMRIHQKNIKVIHSYKGKEESVLLCHWDSGAPNCQVKDDFVFSGIISNRLVITIKHAAQKHVGDYRCKIFGSNESDETCTFILKGIQANCSIPQVAYGRETNLTCIFSENVALSKTDFQIIHTPFNNSDKARRVLTCMWDKESPDCIEDNSYNFTYTITEIVRLRIDYATSYHAGIYSCKALINSEENAGNCTFIPFHRTVTSELKKTSTTPVMTGNSTSPQINDLKNMDSTIVGSVALICAMLAVIVSCVKLRKGHLLRRTVNEYEEIDTQSVMSVCRTTPASVVLVRSTSEKTLSAPFPIINLGSSLPNVSSDETYSCLQLK